MNGISSFEEVEKRGVILEITPSTIKANVWIVVFKDGSQANINEKTYNKLEKL